MDLEDFLMWGMVSLIVLLVLFFIIGIPMLFCIGSCYEADAINKEMETNYSCADMFWAGETIKSINEGPKNRIDLNIEGDLKNEIL